MHGHNTIAEQKKLRHFKQNKSKLPALELYLTFNKYNLSQIEKANKNLNKIIECESRSKISNILK